MKRLAISVSCVVGCAVLLTACGTATPDEEKGGAIAVAANDEACDVARAEADAGTITFEVTNKGSRVTEFYLYAEGDRIMGEVENIGPGLTRNLIVEVPDGGAYTTACKPGMVGDGIRAPFSVTSSEEDSAPSGNDAELVEQANRSYQAYVKDQTEQLVAKTTTFVELYKSGKDDDARALYAPARVHWERIETVAESFGDLDPKMDIREADLEPGQEFTGWHRIEKDLWPARAKGYQPLSVADRAKYADDLLANTNVLYDKTRNLTFTTDQIANGSRGLLDEVATGKVTGEEEYWSRTDLWDFQANVDGARVAFDGLRPILKTKDAELDTEIDEKFVALQGLLDSHRSGDGFKYYNELSAAEVKQLSDAVNALSEPLSKLAAAVI